MWKSHKYGLQITPYSATWFSAVLVVPVSVFPPVTTCHITVTAYPHRKLPLHCCGPLPHDLWGKHTDVWPSPLWSGLVMTFSTAGSNVLQENLNPHAWAMVTQICKMFSYLISTCPLGESTLSSRTLMQALKTFVYLHLFNSPPMFLNFYCYGKLSNF